MNRRHFQPFNVGIYIAQVLSIACKSDLGRIEIYLFKAVQWILSLCQVGYMPGDQKYGIGVCITH